MGGVTFSPLCAAGADEARVDRLRDGAFSAFKSKGHLTLDCSVPAREFERVLDAFDSVLELVSQPKHKDLRAEVDKVLTDFVNRHPSPVVDNTVCLSMLKSGLPGYTIHAHQYFEGAFEFVVRRIELPTELYEFWRRLGELLPKLQRDFRAQLFEDGSPSSTLCILKVWKYTPEPSRQFLIPVHYDRSVFTVISYTRNPGRECLQIGPSGNGEPIVEIGQKWTELPRLCPDASALPLAFPGLHAHGPYGLFATPHAVGQVEEEQRSRSRSSVVFFFVPPKGVHTTSEYVIPE